MVHFSCLLIHYKRGLPFGALARKRVDLTQRSCTLWHWPSLNSTKVGINNSHPSNEAISLI